MREERAENLASGIYGTILSTALIAAYSEDQSSQPLAVALAVVSTSLVFWLAHAYAGMLAHAAAQRSGALAVMRAELARQWPVVTGSIPPVLPLLLAPLGAVSDDTAESLAIATGIAVLAVWGIAIQLRRGRGVIGVAIGAAESAFFGVLVVSLKALVH